MENNWLSHRGRVGLSVVADMLNHRCEIGLNVDENLCDLIQASFDCIEARGVVSRLPLSGLPGIGGSPPLSTASRCSRLPAQCYRQRFQGSRATAALNGVALNFPHDRGRYMRSFRKFALTPSKLSHPLIDGLSDGRPIFRHPIPPRSALAPRLADRSSFCGTPAGPFAMRIGAGNDLVR